ncbi:MULTISPECIES: preprotein translocase subunit YajC [Paenibacillus]|uniref:preprotein translocase subunit YajC n=1 Tax=Paenibacillus TaxID=44249 RepID=UPI0022B8B169|nr:preprotein translocase subunit YajC [Paenibacillus caseinilyticus]MCZ8519055.1 preprotein translocase subunit YajC [Paenibacillus caseinilyticus]
MWELAAAGTPAAEPTGPIAYLYTYGPLVLMFVVLYFLLIRPQQKRQKSRNMLLGNLKKGDKVVTIGGLHGTILELTDDTVILRVNDVTKMTFERSAINSVTSSAGSEEKK